MKTGNRSCCIILIVVLLCCMDVAVASATQDQYVVLKIAGRDHAAVMRIDSGPAKLVRVGEKIGKSGKVIEIVEGRVVIEEGKGKDAETVIIRITDGRQTVERTRKTPPKAQALYGVGK